jgi:hypothetical protein
MSIPGPERDLPAGFRGGADAWDTYAGSLVVDEFFASLTAPVFTVQPSDQSAAVGATATFTATATGAVSFQWQRLAP